MFSLHIIERMDRIGDDVHVSSSSPGGGTGAKSIVSDCILLLEQASSIQRFDAVHWVTGRASYCVLESMEKGDRRFSGLVCV